MRVFILCTGRSGSTTFIKACRHINNFTSAHESSAGAVGIEKLEFPDFHIEADNHLVWFTGLLSKKFDTNDTLYVHLKRNAAPVAESYVERWEYPARETSIRAFAYGQLQRRKRWPKSSRRKVAQFFVETVNGNIEAFLENQHNTLTIDLSNISDEFPKFWSRVGAEGDLSAALCEFDVAYNSRRRRSIPSRIVRKLFGAFV